MPSRSSNSERSAARLSISTTVVARGAALDPPPVELAAQPPDQPHLALAVAGQDHRAGVRQRLERRAGRRRRSRARRPRAARARARLARLSARLAASVVVPLPGMPNSSRLPSSRSQPTGYCVCRRGSSASATIARGAVARTPISSARSICAGSGSGHGLRGGRDALGVVGLDDRVDEPRQVGRALARRASSGPSSALARRAAELERHDLDRRVALGVGHARDQRGLDRDDLVRAEPDVGAARAGGG